MSRNNEDATIYAPTPLYIVAASLGSAGEEFQPLFLEDAPPGGTFDDALRPALRGIWYALHLPKTRFETLDLSLEAIQAGPLGTPHPHTIALIPDTLLQKLDLLRVLASAYDPTLIIADAAAMPAAAAASATIGATLPPITFGATSQLLLDDHWRQLTEAWSADWPEGHASTRRRCSGHGLSLPTDHSCPYCGSVASWVPWIRWHHRGRSRQDPLRISGNSGAA